MRPLVQVARDTRTFALASFPLHSRLCSEITSRAFCRGRDAREQWSFLAFTGGTDNARCGDVAEELVTVLHLP